ncbi:MAG: hypothetical protein SGILL_007123, partial [Bacillariaceae sp.]
RNVRRTLALTFFMFMSRSMWSQAPLSLFIAMAHPHHLEYVGYITAAIGFSQVVSTSLSKYLLRKYQLYNRKAIVLTSLIGTLATAASIKAILIDPASSNTVSLMWLFAAMSLWGTAWGTCDAILPVVFMESASLSENQDKKFRRCSRLIKGGNFCGGAMALGLFYWLGNVWTLGNCAVVMAVGLLLNEQVFFLLCSLRILPIEEAEDLGYEEEVVLEETSIEFDLHDMDCEQQEIDVLLASTHPHDLGCLQRHETLADGEADQQDDEARDGSTSICCCKSLCDARVPLLISMSDILSSFAGGMAVRYFPIFLAQQVALPPLIVQGLYLLVPIGQWISPYLAKGLAKCCGPLRISILFQWTFVIVMLSMIIGQANGLSTCGVCILFVMHGSLMNSTSALTKMTLSQNASAETIQRWRVADKLQMVLWAFGALIGGYIAGQFGMTIIFFATGALQLVASIPLVLLFVTSDADTWIDWDKVEENGSLAGQDGDNCLSSDGIFQDCICDVLCSGSPTTSDATSVTHSATSSDDVLSGN